MKMLLRIRFHAYISLEHKRCVWYLLCPRTQRKHSAKKATPVLYICGCFCMVGVVFIPETDNREHKTNRS